MNQFERVGEPAKCPFSLKDTENTLPFDAYSLLRRGGEVVWDDKMGVWLVTSVEACRRVFAGDNVLFRHPDGDSDGDYAAMAKGLRPLKALVGEQHRKLHNWLMVAFSPRETAAIMDGIVREVIEDTLKDLEGRTKFDLIKEFVDRIPVRVIAAVMDLPWKDKEWVSKAQSYLNDLGAFFNRRMAMTPEISLAASEATSKMRELLDPVIEQRREGTGSDLVSKLWRDGVSIIPDWGADDTFVHMNTVFLGGYDTSSLAISNALYVLLDNEDLMERMRSASDDELQRFVEEVLRMLPPIHYRARKANQDIEIGGVLIRENDVVLPLLGAANRDEKHYSDPEELHLERNKPRDHLTFIAGPRGCIGQGLARAEIREAVKAFIARYPRAKFDPDAPKPSYVGLTMRRYEPITVTVD